MLTQGCTSLSLSLPIHRSPTPYTRVHSLAIHRSFLPLSIPPIQRFIDHTAVQFLLNLLIQDLVSERILKIRIPLSLSLFRKTIRVNYVT